MLILNIMLARKGVKTMTQNEQIKNLIQANDGMIQTSQVIALGISKPVLYRYIRDNGMEQIAHGV